MTDDKFQMTNQSTDAFGEKMDQQGSTRLTTHRTGIRGIFVICNLSFVIGLKGRSPNQRSYAYRAILCPRTGARFLSDGIRK